MVTISEVRRLIGVCALVFTGCGGDGLPSRWNDAGYLVSSRTPPQYSELTTQLALERSMHPSSYRVRVGEDDSLVIGPAPGGEILSGLEKVGLSYERSASAVAIRGERTEVVKAAERLLEQGAVQRRIAVENAAGMKAWGYRRLTSAGQRDLTPGQMITTGRVLDLAIDDPTGTLYFRAMQRDKTPVYLRTMRLTIVGNEIRAQNNLVPMGPLPDVPDDGAIEVTTEGWVRVSGSKNVLANRSGLLMLGRLTDPGKVEFKDGWLLVPNDTEAVVPCPTEQNGPVRSGMLEGPNIEAGQCASQIALAEAQCAFAHAILEAVGEGSTAAKSVKVRGGLPWTGATLVALTGGARLPDGTVCIPLSNPAQKRRVILTVMDAIAKRVEIAREDLAHAQDTAAVAEAAYKPRTVRLDETGKPVVEPASAQPRRIYEPNNPTADKEGYVYRPAVFPEVSAVEIEKAAAEYEVLRTLLLRVDPDTVCPPLSAGARHALPAQEEGNPK